MQINKYLLPDAAHVLFSCLQQEVLREPKVYGHRYKNHDDYTIKSPNYWLNEYDNTLYVNLCDAEHVIIQRNNFALTGNKSYTLVPNTPSCISDCIEMTFHGYNQWYWLHTLHDVIITVLNNEGKILNIETVDLRQNNREVDTIDFECTPCQSICIPRGVAYKLNAVGALLIRREVKMIMSKTTIELTDTFIGNDIHLINENDIHNSDTINVVDEKDNVFVPDMLRVLAKIEIDNLKMYRN